jgi:hypothetical protein
VWEVLVWIFLFGLATARAITTATNKTFDLNISNGYDQNEKLILKEDAEHWWMAVIINGLLLTVGVVLFFAPQVELPPMSWHFAYTTYASLLFAVLINIRIERHGWYYRKRNEINIFGRPRDEGLWRSFKRVLRLK